MLKLAYIWSLRNAAADRAGRYIDYKGAQRYMMSPLEYLAGQLNHTALGERYSLVGVINDDDELSIKDREKLNEVGFDPSHTEQWLFPKDLAVQGKKLTDILIPVPSTYRRLPQHSPGRIAGKKAFEKALEKKLIELDADLVILDGLLVILDALVQPGSPYFRKIVNIHPGITRIESPYERRGAYATLDALYGAGGAKVIDWSTMKTIAVPPLLKTGASFHYVDDGIDSGEVITDLLKTDIDPADTIFELRWNNFHNSLFPALAKGLEIMAKNNVPRKTIIETIA
jgi:folate-dependent phosphoribosylglycinamide formyltransferase PurN